MDDDYTRFLLIQPCHHSRSRHSSHALRAKRDGYPNTDSRVKIFHRLLHMNGQEHRSKGMAKVRGSSNDDAHYMYYITTRRFVVQDLIHSFGSEASYFIKLKHTFLASSGEYASNFQKTTFTMRRKVGYENDSFFKTSFFSM